MKDNKYTQSFKDFYEKEIRDSVDKFNKSFKDFLEEEIEIFDNNDLSYLEKSILDEKAYILKKIWKEARHLSHSHESILKDKEFLLQCISINKWSIHYAHESLCEDKEFMLKAAKYSDCALLYASESLRKDREFSLDCILKNTYSLQYCDKSFKNDINFIIQIAINISNGEDVCLSGISTEIKEIFLQNLIYNYKIDCLNAKQIDLDVKKLKFLESLFKRNESIPKNKYSFFNFDNLPDTNINYSNSHYRIKL